MSVGEEVEAEVMNPQTVAEELLVSYLVVKEEAPVDPSREVVAAEAYPRPLHSELGTRYRAVEVEADLLLSAPVVEEVQRAGVGL